MALVLVAQLALVADVLVLKDGRRVSGTLVEVRGDRIEFESRDGRVRRYDDRSDVRSILLDEEDEDRPGWGRGGLHVARPTSHVLAP